MSGGIVFGYVGALGQGYLGREVFRFFRIAQEKFPNSRMLVVSRTDRTLIEEMCSLEGVSHKNVEIKAVSPADVPGEISRMDLGLSFIKPHYSKIASSPTKVGEYLACGVPVLANSGIGDIDSILKANEVGMVVGGFGEEDLRGAVKNIGPLLRNDVISGNCRNTAEKIFSLEIGSRKYASMYERIMN